MQFKGVWHRKGWFPKCMIRKVLQAYTCHLPIESFINTGDMGEANENIFKYMFIHLFLFS